MSQALRHQREQERQSLLEQARQASSWKRRLIALATPEQIAETLGLPNRELAAKLSTDPRLARRLVQLLARRMVLPDVRSVSSAALLLLDMEPQTLQQLTHLVGLVFNSRRLGPVLTKTEVEALRANHGRDALDFAFQSRALAPEPDIDRRTSVRFVALEEAMSDGSACLHAWLDSRARSARTFVEGVLPPRPMMVASPEAVSRSGPSIVEHVMTYLQPSEAPTPPAQSQAAPTQPDVTMGFGYSMGSPLNMSFEPLAAPNAEPSAQGSAFANPS